MNFDTSKLIGFCDERLRDYQVELKHEILKQWDNNKSIMLQMPTGTGKTVLFGSIVNTINAQLNNVREYGVKILIVAHRVEILEQIAKVIKSHKLRYGIVQGNEPQNWRLPIQIASNASILSKKNIKKAKEANFDFVIIDEAHHTLANTYTALFKTYPNARFLGVTATPWRYNHASFKEYFNCLIQSKPVEWFIKNGYLSDFSYVSIKRDSYTQNLVNNTRVEDTGDFSEIELDKEFNCKKIRANLLKAYLKYAIGKKGIVYAINIKHAQKIAELYTANGINTAVVDSENTSPKERTEIVNQFRRGKVDVLVNVNIFTEGFDVPDIEFVQLARPTRSLVIYLQQVGRGLRKNGDVTTLILDNVGLYNYFGLPNVKRRWMKHFIGIEAEEDKLIEQTKTATQKRDFSRDLSEEDEEMTIVYGDVVKNENYDNIVINEVEDDKEETVEDVENADSPQKPVTDFEDVSFVLDKEQIDHWIRQFKHNGTLPKEKSQKKQRAKYSGKSLEYFENCLKKLLSQDDENKDEEKEKYIPEEPNKEVKLSKDAMDFVNNWNKKVWIPSCEWGISFLYDDERLNVLPERILNSIYSGYNNLYRICPQHKLFTILREIRNKYGKETDDYSRSIVDGAKAIYEIHHVHYKEVLKYLDCFASPSSKIVIKSTYPIDDTFFDRMFCNWDGMNLSSFLKFYTDLVLFYEICHVKLNLISGDDSEESQKWYFDNIPISLRLANLFEKCSAKKVKKAFVPYSESFKEKIDAIIEFDRKLRKEQFEKDKRENPEEYEGYETFEDLDNEEAGYSWLGFTSSNLGEFWKKQLIEKYINLTLSDIDWQIEMDDI